MSLLLAAHGERREGAANEGVARLAAALSKRGLYSEVGIGFIKGTPTIGEALRALLGGEILVYPLFMSDGYFTRARLTQLLEEATAAAAGRTIHILPPLGLDPGLPELIAGKAATAARKQGWAPREAAVFLLAHGSSRDAASRSAAERVADGVRRSDLFRRVGIALLEEAPSLRDATAHVREPLVVMGLFSGEGMHGASDAPRLVAELGRADAVHVGAIGSFDEIENLVAAALERTIKASREDLIVS